MSIDDCLLPAVPRCDACRGEPPTAGEDGRARIILCLACIGVVNRHGNEAAGLDPEQEQRDHGHITGMSPTLAALQPPDGLHCQMTLPGHTLAAVARLLAVAPGH